ncbi:DUF4232 domain-containing protein [Streptomyces sp. NPDC020379]|uniref:DUF4232 domain-containing protein n=1 Tax=Streptomyces sp. NPDC020379 TaxID=3365071 RepID=UPI0037B44879
MRKNPLRTTALAATALAGVLSLSACGGGGGKADAAASPSAGAAAPSSPSASRSADQGGREADGGAGGSAKVSASPGHSAGAHSGSSTGGKGGKASADGDGGKGGKSGYGQACGTNDLTWSARSETQAGGYILISVKAKPGITCTLPGAHPVVALGSDGTEAGPAEQAATEEVRLSGGITAYAGMNPKTTNSGGRKELADITVSVGEGDPTGPVGLTTGSITVDRPVVTNWHTSRQAAVPR